jgi:stage V sporulation protein G
MEVTEIRVFLAEEDRLKAYVTVTFDNCFVVRDLKVIHGNNGLFVAMPSKKKKDGTYKDIAHPIHADFRNYLENLILEKYHDEAKMVSAGFSVKKATDGDYDDAPDLVTPASQQPTTPLERRRDFEVGIGPRGEEE